MAVNDLVVFEEAKATMLEGDWASTDVFYCAVLENTTVPTAAFATPTLADFTEVTAAGSYTAGGVSIGTLASCVTEAGGVMTFNSLEADPTWAQNASNTATAYWGLVYNFTDAGNDALCFIDLGGPVDMTAGSLTITWNASGLFTIT